MSQKPFGSIQITGTAALPMPLTKGQLKRLAALTANQGPKSPEDLAYLATVSDYQSVKILTERHPSLVEDINRLIFSGTNPETILAQVAGQCPSDSLVPCLAEKAIQAAVRARNQ